MIEGVPGVALVRVTTFGERTAEELAAAADALAETGDLQGIVIDLRGNPGGLLSAAIDVCDLFLDDGVIVHTRGRRAAAPGEDAAIETRRAAAGAKLAGVPMMVLVDGLTASAAEIVAACDEPSLPMALATLAETADPAALGRATSRLRLSTREAREAEWLRAGVAAIEGGPAPESRPWSDLQPWAADDRAAALADLLRARAACGRADTARAAWFTERVGRPRAEIDPPPLVTGTDLLAAGVPAGRAVGAALARLRTMQLDGAITTREQALDAVRDD
jgi:hypothetical protein